jgi:peroxiredoxin
MKLKHLVIGLCVLVLASVAGILSLAPDATARAPDLTVNSLQGEAVRVGQLRGGPLLVSFWASTCRTCIREIPHLVELHEEFSPRGLEILAIAMAYDPPNRVVELSRMMKLPYTVALDLDGEAARAFGDVEQTPTAFLIGADGRIVYRGTGSMDTERIRALLADMTVMHTVQADPVATR